MKENRLATYAREYIPIASKKVEKIMLSLRTTKGLNLEEYKNEFKEDLLETKAEEIEKLMKIQMLEIVDGYLRITDKYFYVSNSIIVELI